MARRREKGLRGEEGEERKMRGEKKGEDKKKRDGERSRYLHSVHCSLSILTVVP